MDLKENNKVKKRNKKYAQTKASLLQTFVSEFVTMIGNRPDQINLNQSKLEFIFGLIYFDPIQRKQMKIVLTNTIYLWTTSI